ncbi:MAG: GMC family oxidoreductase [Candidatus Binatia bacterium]
MLGNTSLERFDALVVGSGAGGAAAAYVLTSAGLDVLILEAGDNNFPGLDDPTPGQPTPRYSNDELKGPIRLFDRQDPVVEPRTFRAADTVAAQPNADVNLLNRTVGGTTVHADMKYPRFNEVDFRLASALADADRLPTDASFVDWPLTYDELEPWYAEAERITGVAGLAGADPFASHRSGPYPMPPSPEMYVGRVLSHGARRAGYTPFHYPAAINSRPYPPIPALQRPPCVNCGFCSGFGCPSNAKSSAAVTTLRAALLSGRCQLRYNCFARRLVVASGGGRVSGVEYVDPGGEIRTAGADHVVLAASAMESARLALLSDLPLSEGPAFHLGRHMLFHRQTLGVGIFKQRLHGERGQSVTNGISDFRGVNEGGTALHPDGRPLGGIVEFGTSSEPIGSGKSATDSLDVAANIPAAGDVRLKQLLVESPFHAHIAVLIMQAEDAPQATNRVDLDPSVRDVFGLPVVRLTYASHRFELDAAAFYKPKLVEIARLAGAQFGFVDPTSGGVPRSRHVLGGLRMGDSPATSVTDRWGRFHDFENLYCMDGGVMPTGSGYNPTLTLIALALRAAAHVADPDGPERRIGQGPLSF